MIWSGPFGTLRQSGISPVRWRAAPCLTPQFRFPRNHHPNLSYAFLESARVAPERWTYPVPPADLASIGIHVTREVTQVCQGAEKELEEFLAVLPSWQQKVVQQDISSLLQNELLLWVNYDSAELGRLKREYESIIQRIPGEWPKYRKRAMLASQMFPVPKGKPGRRRKTALAEEAASLQRAGMNHPQIASELNKRHGHGTTTSEAVRKLLKRHPDKS